MFRVFYKNGGSSVQTQPFAFCDTMYHVSMVHCVTKGMETNYAPKIIFVTIWGVKCDIQKGVNILTLTTGVSFKTVPTLIIKMKIK